MPDRAANRISSHSLTCFFQLGGVLISNRMPDELFKATGRDFMSPPGELAQKEFQSGVTQQTTSTLDLLKFRKLGARSGDE